ncbi:MAG: DUF2254 domain-containing protein [Bdellovibrionales bacterium]
MRLYLAEIWEFLRGSFWFIPSLMVASGLVLAIAMLQFDRSVSNDWLAHSGIGYARGPEGARALLSTVASSMITIASLTFSITIVTLQLASSQFGPRLLRNFIRDRGNQMVLGTFIATFAYCLMVLRSVNGTGENEFVPQMAIAGSIMLALTSLGVLIYFIHHIAYSIQANHVIAGVGDEFREAMERLYPEKMGQDTRDTDEESVRELPPDLGRQKSFDIKATQSNYLQSIDSEKLFGMAVEHDLTFEFQYRPGQFIIDGAVLARCWPQPQDDLTADHVLGAFYFGPQRTIVQDFEFAIDQLVEVAVRALSPGINDPFTAMSCIDRLAAGIAELAGRRIPGPRRYDKNNRLRIIAKRPSHAEIIHEMFSQIREAARHNTAVTIHMLDAIRVLLARDLPDSFRAALLDQAALINDGSRQGLYSNMDRQNAARHYSLIVKPGGSGMPDER